MKLRTKIAQNPPGRGKRNLSKFAKKVCSLVLAAGLLLASSSITSWAGSYNDVTVNDISYMCFDEDDGTRWAMVESNQSTNLSGSISIPSSVTCNGKSYSVTTLDSWAFWRCTGITSALSRRL